MVHSELSLIDRYFNKNQMLSFNVQCGIGDDCALVNIPNKKTLAITTDTMICGKHFLPNIDPSDLAHKCLAVNMSDLAAMGAKAQWLTLVLTLPYINDIWLGKFSETLFKLLTKHNLQLIGGDTSAGPLSVTLTIYGLLPCNLALRRSGAKLGDLIYVTGTLGDSAAGLAILQNKLIIHNHIDTAYFIQCHLRPIPRISQGQVLLGYANSAIDISDGLVLDLNRLLKASHVGASINLDVIPFSDPILRNIEYNQAMHLALFGGEDYELCFTIPSVNNDKLDMILNKLKIKCTCIGEIISINEGVNFFSKGRKLKLNNVGYDHFK